MIENQSNPISQFLLASDSKDRGSFTGVNDLFEILRAISPKVKSIPDSFCTCGSEIISSKDIFLIIYKTNLWQFTFPTLFVGIGGIVFQLSDKSFFRNVFTN